jgi:hypothetical protein
MTRPKLTSHADRDVVESFLERGYLLVEGTPAPTLMGDLLDALDGADAHHDRCLGRAPASRRFRDRRPTSGVVGKPRIRRV